MKVNDVKLIIDDSPTQSFIVTQTTGNPRFTSLKAHRILLVLDNQVVGLNLHSFKEHGTRLTKNRLKKFQDNFENVKQELMKLDIKEEDIKCENDPVFLVNGKVDDMALMPSVDQYSKVFDEIYQIIYNTLNQK